MVIAMILAHLVGDYILQWDELARWKSQEYKGVLVHGLIVWLITWLFALPFDTSWWPWVVFIGVTHLIVDAAQLPIGKWLATFKHGSLSMVRFLIDQLIHFTIIFIALAASGYLDMVQPLGSVADTFENHRLLSYALGYAFISMPAWIFVEFLVYGLINNSPPDFTQSTNKYVGILERWLITTFVILGQFLLIPLVALPRLLFEGRDVVEKQRGTIYVAELLGSIGIAIIIGVGLRYI